MATSDQMNDPQKLTAALDAIPDQVALLDRAGRIVFVNKSWTAFGLENGARPETTSVGARYLDVCTVPVEEPQTELAPIEEDVGARLKSLLEGTGSGFQFEYPCHSPTAERWVLMRAERLNDGGVVVVHTDITRQKRAQIDLHNQAIRDPLTALLNRRGLQHRLAAELSRTRRAGGTLSAVLLDCDDFKRINDQYGHSTGDIVLREIARRLCECLRPEDVICRLGGDEFLVLLPETNITEAFCVAERVRLAFSAVPVAVSHGPLELTVSLSAVEVDESVNSTDDVLRLSQTGLRQSKNIGKNHTATTGLHRKPAPSTLDWAIQNLHVAVQDIRELHTMRQAAVEFLIRGPPGLFEQPDTLFRSAIEQQLLGVVDRACLRACLQATSAVTQPKVHVNVYPSTLISLEPETLLSWLPGQISAADICLELCEQQILGDPAHLIPHLDRLRDFGFQIGIDDVGFGRSCLENLVVLEPDVIKIDRRFGSGASKDLGKGRMLERLLRVATTLHAMVVVEGIEDQSDADFIAELGASHGQGYLWGKPQRIQPLLVSGVQSDTVTSA